ncbi:hypothetical protein B484DRAFT_408171 [Ochromonadaceae sp. CCMP2298]|nr:hypothetical protein B484DRAFT_408171 [Ochromonadaceae sp. CCMP2298]
MIAPPGTRALMQSRSRDDPSCLAALQRIVEQSFEIRERNSSIGLEVFCGCLHFVSSLFILPVIPIQLEAAGYDKGRCIQTTALASAAGCILSSYLTNLPFIIAPPSAISIYVAVALQRGGMQQNQGDAAVILSGFVLLFVGVFKPLVSIATRLIPDCIQASTAIGIGLITALAGAIELKLVVPGNYTILEMGTVTPSIVIALLATVVIAVALYHKQRAAYVTGMVFGTAAWWLYSEDYPTSLFALPNLQM